MTLDSIPDDWVPLEDALRLVEWKVLQRTCAHPFGPLARGSRESQPPRLIQREEWGRAELVDDLDRFAIVVRRSETYSGSTHSDSPEFRDWYQNKWVVYRFVEIDGFILKLRLKQWKEASTRQEAVATSSTSEVVKTSEPIPPLPPDAAAARQQSEWANAPKPPNRLKPLIDRVWWVALVLAVDDGLPDVGGDATFIKSVVSVAKHARWRIPEKGWEDRLYPALNDARSAIADHERPPALDEVSRQLKARYSRMDAICAGAFVLAVVASTLPTPSDFPTFMQHLKELAERKGWGFPAKVWRDRQTKHLAAARSTVASYQSAKKRKRNES